jgi:hypothetical protein
MTTLENTVPVELSKTQTSPEPSQESPLTPTVDEAKIVQYVVSWRDKLKNARTDKVNIWNECWQLYRGLEDFSDKEDWQSKIVLPKAWASVKSATSTIKRLLSSAKAPWQVESVNPDDLVMNARAEQMGQLARVFLEKASYMDEFSEGLECGFIIGVGIWKQWWALQPRTRTRVRVGMEGPDGQFYEIPSETLQALGQAGTRQLVREEVMEGRLMLKVVDPYNFYWLPGSKLNRWTGTIEEFELPKWELMELAKQGVLDSNKVKDIQPMKIKEDQKQSYLRFSERPGASTPSPDTDSIKGLEFYGPLIIDGELVMRDAHILIANDQTLLLNEKQKTWTGRPPYVGFSPLTLPFRTEGVGLVERVRQIDKALSKLANMSVDTLMYKLLPLFEVNFDAYENAEDLETGITPGKILRRNSAYLGQPGIMPVQFEDISQGSVQVSATLDRAHQEGALVSEIQQAIPRYRGIQTATEIQEKSENQDSFFGAMAADIETQALAPMIEMAVDLILQYIATADDPRVASILGLGAQELKSMKQEELMELVQGDYSVKVTGITGQLQKAEMLQNLVQLMNLIGQNAQAWMPYVNQDALLRRVLEAFRPSIREIEDIVAEPAMIEARKAAASAETLTPDMVAMIPQLVQMALDQKKQEQADAMAKQQQQQQQAQIQQQQQHETAIKATEADMANTQQASQQQHELALAEANASTRSSGASQ